MLCLHNLPLNVFHNQRSFIGDSLTFGQSLCDTVSMALIAFGFQYATALWSFSLVVVVMVVVMAMNPIPNFSSISTTVFFKDIWEKGVIFSLFLQTKSSESQSRFPSKVWTRTVSAESHWVQTRRVRLNHVCNDLIFCWVFYPIFW